MGRGIADVLDFHKGNKKIQIIIPVATSPLEIIISFHSTCVMNFITHNKAFSLYPWSTFVTKEALAVQSEGALAGREAGREKYKDRGWKMVEYPSLSSNSELGVRMNRSVSDRFTWVISLPPPPRPFFYGTTGPDSAHPFKWHIDCDGDTTSTTIDTAP
ncbi:hypothetical protein B0H12DRAFT_202573 [Mycena haematopus]|nr:hypothetical protein B0H12DRAFT_202573 [Mycena haematopus]